MLFGMLSATTDALAAGAKAAWTGKGLVPGKSLLEETLPPAVRDLAENTTIGQGIGYASALWRMPTRALGAEDAVFKTFAYQAEVYASAYREMARTGDWSHATLMRLIENPDPAVVHRANQFALAQTFQRALDSTIPGEALGPVFSGIGQVGTAIQDVTLGALPVGRLLVPVLRTPVNLAHFVTERTPILGMLSQTWQADIAAGGAARSQAIAKQAGGALLFASAAYFAQAGIITGMGPTNPILRKQQEEL